MDSLPKHIAFIMDGNRRWAKENKLSLFFGHENGAKKIEPIVEHGLKLGIKYMTFWAFSTENWQRSDDEVNDILNVFRKALRDPMIQRLKEKKTRITIIGNLAPFPDDIKEEVLKLVEDSAENDRMVINIALNYGGRAEILDAIKKIPDGEQATMTEETFSRLLYTAGQPDPDFIIRTGGDERLSGYLPWQSVYAELYFTKTYWPAFDTDALDQALQTYANRQRRFGK